MDVFHESSSAKGEPVDKDMIFTNIIIGPEYSAPRPPTPSKTQPRLDWIDEHLVAHLREAGALPVWSLVNLVVNDQCPRDRTASRLLGLHVLGRLGRLTKLGLAFPFRRNWISATKPHPIKRRRTVRRSRATVVRSNFVRSVSAPAKL